MEDDNRRLYPLRFVEEGVDVAWGHVSYHIADLGFKDSMVDNGWFGGNTLSELMATYLERVVGDDAFEFYGLQFPVLLKVITTNALQPLQVSASDDVAAERYDSLGKTAFWYVREASEDSVLYLGFKRDMDAGEFYRRCVEGSVAEVLNEVRPRKGDSFLIKPGTVFAAGPGLSIVEISESSELTFNLHNWGRELSGPEEILLEEAFDIIDFKAFETVRNDSESVGKPDDVKPDEKLVTIPEFAVTRLDLKDAVHIFSEQPGSFAAYFCLSGEASIRVPSEGGPSIFPLREGHSVLVPSEVNDFLLVPAESGTVVLEALVEKRMVEDSYTGVLVEPTTRLNDEAAAEENATDHHLRSWN